MYVIFFILLCVAVTVIVGLTAHFARKEDEEEPPVSEAPDKSVGAA